MIIVLYVYIYNVVAGAPARFSSRSQICVNTREIEFVCLAFRGDKTLGERRLESGLYMYRIFCQHKSGGGGGYHARVIDDEHRRRRIRR